MANKTASLLPATDELLRQFGDRLRLARLRRRLSAKQVAERAGMAPMTLRSLERGGSGVTMGAYLAVMQVLGIEKDLDLLGKADPVGRELQDARLPAPTKAPRPSVLPSDRRLATGKGPLPVAGAASELRHAMESAPEEQLRQLFNSLPSEKMRKALEALPQAQMRKALAAIPSVKPRETVDRPDAPRREIKKLLKPSEDARDWIEKGGFASADTLAGLIEPLASLKKKGH
ncbi:helix-turn-helix domain-containing protein [Variovorax paradoxus]|uniref:helix-turn-helix domain-containing protein n=1 Tax=Variovorax paradoxus TaxID=34073 RepID=UPI002782AEF4|nr:helix-turn-helix domain-containing protein [Variovorax paradoxus]MDQ0586576.1 transcriptional regulator with XRE-family HTH domain [Variovorax paradoxus]